MADPLAIDDLAGRLANIESGGKYDAQGPVTSKGDRAYGKYQVMGANIPEWTRDATGVEATPDAFLADPDLQERVVKHRLTKYYDEFGNARDVASMWHSGVPYDRAAAEGRADQLGTKTTDYADRVAGGAGGGGGGGGAIAMRGGGQPTIVVLPDGRRVNLGVNPSAELQAQVKAKIIADFPDLAPQAPAAPAPTAAEPIAPPADLTAPSAPSPMSQEQSFEAPEPPPLPAAPEPAYPSPAPAPVGKPPDERPWGERMREQREQSVDAVAAQTNRDLGYPDDNWRGRYMSVIGKPVVDALTDVITAPEAPVNPDMTATEGLLELGSRVAKILHPLAVPAEIAGNLANEVLTDAGAPPEVAAAIATLVNVGVGAVTPVPGIKRTPTPKLPLQGTKLTRAAAQETAEAAQVSEAAATGMSTEATTARNIADDALRAKEDAAIAAEPSVAQRTRAQDVLTPETPPQPLTFADDAKIESVAPEPDYAYHVTNQERVHEIAESGELRTHRPSDFTDQDAWPDGSTTPRAYFADQPRTYFAPEDGRAAVVRVRRDAVPLKAESTTRDLYSTKSIDASNLEVLGDDGTWQPLVGREGTPRTTPLTGGEAAAAELGRQLDEVKTPASGIYEAVLATETEHATRTGVSRIRSLDPSHYKGLSEQIAAIRAELGETLVGIPKKVVDDLDNAINTGQRLDYRMLDAYKKQLDTLFEGRVPHGATPRQRVLYNLKWDVRDKMRTIVGKEEREWLEAADAIWRDEVIGRDNPYALGQLAKLAKKNPQTFAERVLQKGTSDKNTTFAEAVMKRLGKDSTAGKKLSEAVMARTIDDATDAATGQLDPRAFLKTISKMKRGFYDAMVSKEADTLFTVMRKELTDVGETATQATRAGQWAKAAQREADVAGTAAEAGRTAAATAAAKAAEPNRLARFTATGIEIGGAAAATAINPTLGAVVGGAIGTGKVASRLSRYVIPGGLSFAKLIADSPSANLLARALITPLKTPASVAIMEQLYNRGTSVGWLPAPTVTPRERKREEQHKAARERAAAAR